MDNIRHVTEISIEKQQHVEHSLDVSSCNRESFLGPRLVTYRFVLQESSSLQLKLLGVGDQSFLCRVEVILEGQGAHATIHGCYALRGNAQQTIELVQEHKAPHTTSYSLVQSALTHNAAFVYNGIIKIAQTAHGADAALYNKNILLSETAKAFGQPSLEVLTHAVTCKHGTATSSFDEEQLVYLQSRGLSVAKSKELLIRAFFSTVFGLESTQLNSITEQLLRHE